MFVNRLTGRQPQEEPAAPEFWMVCGGFGTLLVARAEAESLLALLRRRRVPRWVRVRDLSGSEVWLPSGLISVVVESTAEQRAFDRELRRQLERENEDNGGNWSGT